ncbi:hypothetical protein MUN74_02685 [Agromyces endophyticus]|uniref:LGFP repeat-containing protein n=1 Tax=Agromyces sp. H17E-10 TaxID=2932244 RepID=UPI001FD13D4F|nr:hypothetical protein [Agromyces sp. H17E-10]UOQ89845.1 hypothetical protein MUN74_02685 [Agromyces sp. H17E-10]
MISPIGQTGASAATGKDFNPGNIISDDVFYNSKTMTVDQVQAFLNAKVPICREGYTCLKSYVETTRSQPARSEGCSAYAGQTESAARIIYKVATACGINPRALIVLLEKEQGLVTDTWPTARQYRSATGYGCPDTADCDVNYYGFFNQLYNAAWQFKKYRARPADRAYQAGRYNTILWHPNSACGSSQVYIQNQATAGLYLYTPYRPNQAALDNLYGTGNDCSSYGNRNFWRMFTDWFGSTTIQVHPLLVAAWTKNGGATGTRLGPPLANAVSLSGGGLMQRFKYGELVYRSDLGAFRTAASISKYYYSKGGVTSGLGYPVSDVAGADAIEHTQSFEFGYVSWKPTSGIAVRGGYRVSGAFLTNWKALKSWSGVLGYPTSNVVSHGSGWTSQRFEKGRLLYSGSVMYWMPTKMWDYWTAHGGLTGSIGAPTTSPKGSATTSWTQRFVYAQLTQSSAGVVTQYGGASVSGTWRTNWFALGGPSGLLGYAVAGVVDEGSGWSSQRFEKGRLLYSGKAMYWLPGKIWDAWKAAGGVKAPIGTPTTSPAGSWSKGWTQQFRWGAMSVDAAGTVKSRGGAKVSGVYFTNWSALGGGGGVLGYAVAGVVDEGSGWSSQRFERGRLLYSGTVMYWLPNAIWDAWKSAGGLKAPVGPPVKSPTGSWSTGWTQQFSNGYLAVDAAGKVRSGAKVSGVYLTNWTALGGGSGVLGFAVAGVVDEGSGWSSQQFERGRLLYSGKVMYWLPGRIWDAWKAAGGLKAPVGVPAKSPTGSWSKGWTQQFTKGSMRVDSAGKVTTTLG